MQTNKKMCTRNITSYQKLCGRNAITQYLANHIRFSLDFTSHLVAEEVGFEYQICEASEYGNELEDKKWSGLVGELNQSKAALSISGLQVDEKYAKAISYLPNTIFSYSIKILMGI